MTTRAVPLQQLVYEADHSWLLRNARVISWIHQATPDIRAATPPRSGSPVRTYSEAYLAALGQLAR